MVHSAPYLLPQPRTAAWGAGELSLPNPLPLVITHWQQSLMPTATRFQQFVRERLGLAVEVYGSPAGLGDRFAIRLESEAAGIDHPEGYRLSLSPSGVLIQANDASGIAHGLATLKQLMAGSGRRLPEGQIEDWPDFPNRGVMLDISRGKVPTMESLFRFVDRLADLKVNQLQLYTEHTFAYQNHREVWQHYSPMTAEEILKLDGYCRERFVELVPNQNSFGHMREWMVHPRYHHLAETLGDWTVFGMVRNGPFSFCPQEPAVIPLLSELYDELLPNFTSTNFNVGCDETFDVGQGRSKAAVEQFGEHRVYLDFLLKIYQQVKARGKTMMFWGDIIIKAPEYIAELPKDVVALEWGYEADHPFDEHCAHFQKAGIPFYVCPGTSTWNTLVGRTENALANMKNAAVNGKKHGAIGFLNTIWGDRGHQDYEPVLYLPLAYGAAISWGVEANQEADVRPYLNRYLFGDRAERLGDLLSDLGNAYLEAGKPASNGTRPVYFLQMGFERPGWHDGITHADMDRFAARVAELGAAIDQVAVPGPEGALLQRELKNSVRMLLHGAELGKMRLDEAAGQKLDRPRLEAAIIDLDAIMAEHRELWLERNRIGGLVEMSLAPMERLRKAYQERLG